MDRRFQKTKTEPIKASVTVEASYVVPIIIGIIFAVMTVSFYFYDITTAQAVLNKEAAKLGNVLIHPYEKESFFYDYAAVNERLFYSFLGDFTEEENAGKERVIKELADSFIILQADNADVQIKGNKITVCTELSFEKQLPGMQYIPFLKKNKKLAVVTVYNHADFARILKRQE